MIQAKSYRSSLGQIPNPLLTALFVPYVRVLAELVLRGALAHGTKTLHNLRFGWLEVCTQKKKEPCCIFYFFKRKIKVLAPRVCVCVCRQPIFLCKFANLYVWRFKVWSHAAFKKKKLSLERNLKFTPNERILFIFVLSGGMFLPSSWTHGFVA